MKTEAFPLVRSSVSGKQVLCTVKAKKANKNIQQRTLPGFTIISVLE